MLRAPLLALETLSSWAAGARALEASVDGDARLERALAADRVLLRARLADLAADDQIAAGLELSSPDLADAIVTRRVDPSTKRGRSAERSLVRYVTRMASRPDLFGLAGAYVTGRFSDQAQLELAPRSELQVRVCLDSGLLRDVVRRAAAEATDGDALAVRRNRGSYRVGGRLRVAARKPGTPNYRLVEIRPTPTIEQALDCAAGDGAAIGSLVAALTAGGVTSDHARQVIRRLIASELLVPVAQVSVTGPDPGLQAVEALESLPQGRRYAEAIRSATSAVSSAARIGSDSIDAVSSALGWAGVEVKRRRCLQVNARRPGDLRLPPRALSEMRRSIDILARIAPAGSDGLVPFSEAFERRFGARSVPLLEALDPDFGIRLDEDEHAPVAAAASPAHELRRRRVLLELIERGRAAPDAVVELGDGDVAGLSGEHPALLPGAFAMLTSLTGRDAPAVAAGAFQLVEPAIVGPSGARLLGRLCRGDAELEAHVREHLRREAALEPDAIFAELSVAPETDVGLNVTQRPVLRDWEIEYGGGSGAPANQRLEPSDLLVSVADGEVVLRSARLDRRVIPSCATAMNSRWVSLPAARFLLSLARQSVAAYLAWSWGELADAPALPRITHGRTILALRRWNVTAHEFAEAGTGTDAPGFRRLQEWRIARGLPRVVIFDHPKSPLLVDFGNVLSIDAFLAATRKLDILRFIELPAPELRPVLGPDGHYAHELIVPFTLERTSSPRARPRRRVTPVSESQRRFQPGTEWLYANLYGPAAAADRVLADHVGPLAARLREAGLVDRWFFIRYADPGRHLRVRFHGRPRELLTEVLPALHDATAPALAEGLLYRISLDTYEREIERYGGIEGVELMERASEADSDAVIAILAHTPSAIERRHLAIASLAALYHDAELGVQARHACCIRLRSTWAPGGGASLGALLGAHERSERAQVAKTVAALGRDDAPLTIEPLRRRSVTLAPVLSRLRSLEDEGILEQPFDEIVCSLAHMSVNRILKRAANHDELRVHDALARLYEGQIARDDGRRTDKPPADFAVP